MNRSGSAAAAPARSGSGDERDRASRHRHPERVPRQRCARTRRTARLRARMPPVTGESIEQLVGDDGVYQTTLTLGHDSNKKTGEWSVPGRARARHPAPRHIRRGQRSTQARLLQDRLHLPLLGLDALGRAARGRHAPHQGQQGRPPRRQRAAGGGTRRQAGRASEACRLGVVLLAAEGDATRHQGRRRRDDRLAASRDPRVRCTRHQPAAAERARQAQFDAQGARRRPLPQVL